jgi:hypothetical protein
MSPGEWAEPDGETTDGPRAPVIGSDGAAVPLGGAAVLPGDGQAVRWAWDGAAVAVPGPDRMRVPPPRSEPAATGAGVPDFLPDFLPDADATAVRPYVVTGGRTRASLELSLETLVSTLRKVIPYQLPHDEAAVLDLCRDQSRSVAEVAALHRVPVGVAKVLIADLATAGLVVVHRSFAASGPDQALMERVLGGLRRL